MTKKTDNKSLLDLMDETNPDEKAFHDWLENIPHLTPLDMFKKLGKLGYIGQDRARKAACLMAYRHINRIRRIHLDKIDRKKLPPSENAILTGPTGSGKTYLVTLLFEILDIPIVTTDVTSLTSTGYIGNDVSGILTQLIRKTESNPWQAFCGCLILDEFDKLATSSNNTVFGGGGTNIDVSGAGVQKELLKIIEGSEILVPLEITQPHRAEKVAFNTQDVSFIACGAFSGLKRIITDKKNTISIGFDKESTKKEVSNSPDVTPEEANTIEHLVDYGFMPELIGRFNRIVTLDSLKKEDLVNILRKNTVNQYRKELELEGIKLRVDSKAYNLAAETCIERGTGARGLRNFLTEALEDACFDAFSDMSKKKKSIILSAKSGKIECKLGN